MLNLLNLLTLKGTALGLGLEVAVPEHIRGIKLQCDRHTLILTGRMTWIALLHCVTGDIVTCDFDKSDVTGDNGTWHTYLGRSFLQPGNLGFLII